MNKNYGLSYSIWYEVDMKIIKKIFYSINNYSSNSNNRISNIKIK